MASVWSRALVLLASVAAMQVFQVEEHLDWSPEPEVDADTGLLLAYGGRARSPAFAQEVPGTVHDFVNDAGKQAKAAVGSVSDTFMDAVANVTEELPILSGMADAVTDAEGRIAGSVNKTIEKAVGSLHRLLGGNDEATRHKEAQLDSAIASVLKDLKDEVNITMKSVVSKASVKDTKSSTDAVLRNLTGAESSLERARELAVEAAQVEAELNTRVVKSEKAANASRHAMIELRAKLNETVKSGLAASEAATDKLVNPDEVLGNAKLASATAEAAEYLAQIAEEKDAFRIEQEMRTRATAHIALELANNMSVDVNSTVAQEALAADLLKVRLGHAKALASTNASQDVNSTVA